MPDPSAEFPTPPRREIKIGEEFHPFDKKFIERHPERLYDHYYQGRADVILPKKTLDFIFESGIADIDIPENGHFFTPFNPELGSSLKDMRLAQGSGDEVLELNEDQRVYKNAPYRFHISHEQFTSGKEEFEELKEATDDLHLQVFFPDLVTTSGLRYPGGQFETFGILPILTDRWNGFQILMGEDFYPLRQGPLSEVKSGGIPIFLPDDLEKLAQIRAKFVKHPPFTSIQPFQR